MSRKYKFYEPNGLYFISFAVVYWIDVFTRNEYKDIVLESWKYCQENKGLEIYAWCIMTNHIHMNPVKAGFVENPEDYVYSSARDYAQLKGLIKIKFIE